MAPENESRPGAGAAIQQVEQTRGQRTAVDLLGAALDYARLGWPVFPCKPCGKVPLTVHGCQDATTDHDQIVRWWTWWPTANIGIATGRPAVDVVDIDTKHGAQGAATYQRLRDAGLLRGAWCTVTTPSGGWHLYYAGTDQHNGAFKREGVDFRGAGGYVLAPPSYVVGDGYEGLYRRRGIREGAGLPSVAVNWQAIRDYLRPPVPRPRYSGQSAPGVRADGLVRRVRSSGAGERNNVLFWAAMRAVDQQLPERVYDDLVTAAVATGLPESEARRTITSARRSGGAR